MKKLSFILLSLSFGCLYSQNIDTALVMQKTYTHLEVFDSLGDISRYSNRVAFTGGELIAENGSGNPLEGWNEDFYANGMLLHLGYYVDGKLITFKNFLIPDNAKGFTKIQIRCMAWLPEYR